MKMISQSLTKLNLNEKWKAIDFLFLFCVVSDLVRQSTPGQAGLKLIQTLPLIEGVCQVRVTFFIC